MMTTSTSHWTKGTLVAAVAAVACYAVWAALRHWARDVDDPGAMFAGLFDLLLAKLIGLLAMPVLLWAGMRLLGEPRNLVFLGAATVLWFFVGNRMAENSSVIDVAAFVYLLVFAGLCGLLSLATAGD